MKLEGGATVAIKTTVFEDNNGAISTAKAVKMTPRTKHIAVKYFFFKSHIGEGTGIELVKIDTPSTSKGRHLYQRNGTRKVRHDA
jgi:hypothetical protein